MASTVKVGLRVPTYLLYRAFGKESFNSGFLNTRPREIQGYHERPVVLLEMRRNNSKI